MFDKSLAGRRVRLVRTSDPHTRLRPGAEGHVEHRDDAGTLHVAWVDGTRLGLIDGEDEYQLLPRLAVKRDGKLIEVVNDEHQARQLLLRLSPQSNSWAVKHEGYSVEEVPEP